MALHLHAGNRNYNEALSVVTDDGSVAENVPRLNNNTQ